MPLDEVPKNPLLPALNEECAVSIENLIALAEKGEEVFFAYLNEDRELDFGRGTPSNLAGEFVPGRWEPGDPGTPRLIIRIERPEWSTVSHWPKLIPVTDLMGWTLCSAYPQMDLAGYTVHYLQLAIESEEVEWTGLST